MHGRRFEVLFMLGKLKKTNRLMILPSTEILDGFVGSMQP
jgi:hypothetical protein